MKNLTLKSLFLSASVIALAFTSCSKSDDPDPTPVEPNQFDITGDITEDQTWESGKTYTLKSRIIVKNGATLTIEPGVVVKGDPGNGSNATSLIIARGAKIMAEGTATNPIIFTTSGDQLAPGDIKSPNINTMLNSQWGGLIILGNAPISADAATAQIEGIPVSVTDAKYGGSDPGDNSGVLKYVSIRHGGANIGEGNEINGLTLGGVGNGTTIDHIEIVSNKDDGIEFFGGTVNVNDIIVYAAGDDAIDVDQAWSGTVDNFIVICAGTDHALEIDGPEGAMLDGGLVINGSVKGDRDAMGVGVSEMADFRDGARGGFRSIYFFNFADPALGDFELDDADTKDNLASGALIFDNLEVTLPPGVKLEEVFLAGTDAFATSVPLTNNTVKADKSEFASWTLVDNEGGLDEFK